MTGGKFIAEFLKMRKENGETASPIVTDFEQLAHFSIYLEAICFSTYENIQYGFKKVSLKSLSVSLLINY